MIKLFFQNADPSTDISLPDIVGLVAFYLFYSNAGGLINNIELENFNVFSCMTCLLDKFGRAKS